MTRTFLLAASLATLLAGCSTPPGPARAAPSLAPVAQAPTSVIAQPIVVTIPVDLGLDPEVVAAVHTLANAEAYGGEAVGYSGDPVPTVAALRTIVAAPAAARALELVADQGTLAGQLLALTGLYQVDQAAFAQRIDAYRGRATTVKMYRGGCVEGLHDVTVAQLVAAPGAMQRAPFDETLEQWVRRKGTGPLVLDIAGGGYPLVIVGS